jgi:hypothetical protein
VLGDDEYRHRCESCLRSERFGSKLWFELFCELCVRCVSKRILRTYMWMLDLHLTFVHLYLYIFIC